MRFSYAEKYISGSNKVDICVFFLNQMFGASRLL